MTAKNYVNTAKVVKLKVHVLQLLNVWRRGERGGEGKEEGRGGERGRRRRGKGEGGKGVGG